jgi:3-oxoacyl-[acyl-carrier-protein] synthase-3
MTQWRGRITGYGKFSPPRILTNEEISKVVETSDEWIRERTGIRERRIASEGMNTSDMALYASKEALLRAGITAQDLDLIIVATSSPDYLIPPISSQVQHGLGAKNTAAFTLVLGCAGFVSALITAEQYIRAGTYRTVLVIGAELISRYINWQDRTTCPLFGDGAAAVVLEADSTVRGIIANLSGSDGSGCKLLYAPSGGTAMPPSHETVDNHLHCVQMNGAEVFKFATKIIGSVFKQLLSQANLSSDQIALFIPHQANLRIIEAAARFADFPLDRVLINVERYGNTSAASIPIALCEAYEQDRIKKGDIVALIAFGAGLSWSGALIEI